MSVQPTRLSMWIRLYLLGTAVVTACIACSAQAADHVWDTIPGNGVVNDGSGTWDTNAVNWTVDGGTANVAWPNDANAMALFTGATGGTVSVLGDLAASGILFNGSGAGSYGLSSTNGSTLTLATNGITVSSGAGAQTFDGSLALSLSTSQTWDNDSTELLTIDGAVAATNTSTLTVSGSGNSRFRGILTDGTGVLSLVKDGAGTLTLSCGNNYTGATTVSNGVLIVTTGTVATLNVPAGTADLNSPASALTATVNGGQLNLNGTAALLTLTGGVVVAAGPLATIGTADFSTPGAGIANAEDYPFAITGRARLSGATVSLSGASFFTLSGSNVATPDIASHRLITASGGDLKIGTGEYSYPSNGLVGRWTFDDNTANDSSTNGYDGTIVANPTFSTDTHDGLGKSLNVAGAGYVKVDTGGNQTVFDGGRAMSLSVWVQGWPGRYVSFVSKNGDGGQGWRIGRYNNEGWQYWITRGTTPELMHQNTGFHYVWIMLTVTWDGTTKRFYRNGFPDGELAATGTVTPTAAWLVFGGSVDANNTVRTGNYGLYGGKLDDIYFYSRALTAYEVLQLAGSGPNWPTTDLVVTANSNVTPPGGATTLGFLSLSNHNTRLTLDGVGSTGVSFDHIVADDDASIVGSAPISIRTGNIAVPAGKSLSVAQAIVDGTSPTALNKLGPGRLTLTGNSTYTGDTRVDEGALSFAKARLADDADVHLNAGSTLELTYSGTDTIRSLYIEGTWQKEGVWAAVGSPSPHNRESSYLTSTGTLTVVQGPWQVIIVR